MRGATALPRALSQPGTKLPLCAAYLHPRRPLSTPAPSTVPPSPPQSTYSSINSSEISHFSRLSSQWWDPKGEFGLLHRMNPTRIEYVRQKVCFDPRDEEEWTFEGRKGREVEEVERKGKGRWLEGKSCLDVGCGGGLLSESLARLGGNVIGVDASESNIRMAQVHATQDLFLPFRQPIPSTPSPTEASLSGSSPSSAALTSSASTSRAGIPGSLEYRHTSAEALRDQGETFDLVCAMEVIEHVDEPGEFLKSLGDMVKPGGHLILSTISRTPLSRLLTITLAESVLRLVTPGTHTHSKFIKPQELRAFVHSEMGGDKVWYRNEDGSDVRPGEMGETRGIIYDPVSGGWRLWSAVEGTWGKELGEGCNYMFHVRKRD